MTAADGLAAVHRDGAAADAECDQRRSAIGGEVLDLSGLVTISDPGFVGYQQLELWDSKGTLAGGQFVVNGVAQSGGHEIDVSPANVANTVFDAGTAGGTDTLLARLLQNNGS